MSLTSTVSVVKQPNVQDTFLAAARRLASRVTVFLMNGYQLRVVVSDGKQQVIYKHAISTIAPEHPLELEA